MKTRILLMILIMIGIMQIPLIAQESSVTENQKKKLSEYLVFRLNFLSPSFEIEGLISKQKTTNTILGEFLAGTYWLQEDEGGPVKLKIVPRTRIAYRVYYNMNKREKLGKPTKKFAGNFLSLSADYAFQTERTYSALVFGPTWGMQRNCGGFFHFAFDLGGGYQYTKDPQASKFAFIFNFRIGFTF